MPYFVFGGSFEKYGSQEKKLATFLRPTSEGTLVDNDLLHRIHLVLCIIW